MSADYWHSSQRKFWKFTRDELSEKRRNLDLVEDQLIATGALPIHLKGIEYDYTMRIFIHQLLQKLGRRLGLRAIPISTAEIYILRFLLNVSIKEINIYLLITTAIYLSCKVEECPQHIRTISNEARNLWPEYIPHDVTKIAEFEFYLIEEMDNYMIIHNVYRSLNQIKSALSITDFSSIDNNNNSNNTNTFNRNGPSKLVDGINCLILSPEELQLSWAILNDCHVTDLPLIFPPHIIAMASVYISIILNGNGQLSASMGSLIRRQNIDPTSLNMNNHLGSNNKNKNNIPDYHENRINILTSFMGISNIDLSEIIESVQEILTLYEIWETYDEVKTKKKVHKLFYNR